MHYFLIAPLLLFSSFNLIGMELSQHQPEQPPYLPFEAHTTIEHNNTIFNTAFSHDGNKLMVRDYKTISIYNTQNGTNHTTIDLDEGYFTPWVDNDNSFLLYTKKNVNHYNSDTGTLINTSQENTSPLQKPEAEKPTSFKNKNSTITFTIYASPPEGNFFPEPDCLALKKEAFAFGVWYQTHSCCSPHNHSVEKVKSDPTNELNNIVYLVRLDYKDNPKTITLSAVQELKNHCARINALAWHPTKEQLASGDISGTVTIWDTQKSTVLKTLRACKAEETLRACKAEAIIGLDWHPTKNILAYSSPQNGIEIHNTVTGKLENSFLIFPIKALKWNPVHHQEIMVTTDFSIKIINYKSGQELQHINVPKINCFTLDQTGNRLAVATDQTITLYEKQTKKDSITPQKD